MSGLAGSSRIFEREGETGITSDHKFSDWCGSDTILNKAA